VEEPRLITTGHPLHAESRLELDEQLVEALAGDGHARSTERSDPCLLGRGDWRTDPLLRQARAGTLASSAVPAIARLSPLTTLDSLSCEFGFVVRALLRGGRRSVRVLHRASRSEDRVLASALLSGGRRSVRVLHCASRSEDRVLAGALLSGGRRSVRVLHRASRSEDRRLELAPAGRVVPNVLLSGGRRSVRAPTARVASRNPAMAVTQHACTLSNWVCARRVQSGKRKPVVTESICGIR